MAGLTDDADHDAGEAIENVLSPLSDAGNHGNHYVKRLRARCVLLRRPDNKNTLRQRSQPTSLLSLASKWKLSSKVDCNLYLAYILSAIPTINKLHSTLNENRLRENYDEEIRRSISPEDVGCSVLCYSRLA
ncbi:unnamed protein product [Protopolystoma xenopodis]|uniref:Uncharacterized protein n=1 Tax=Protopolystoma xenopodis TaxID=117903 RepID=A0A448WL57_9PLAT|nr:unnamed protein product [Protopolystoma xenopodis]